MKVYFKPENENLKFYNFSLHIKVSVIVFHTFCLITEKLHGDPTNLRPKSMQTTLNLIKKQYFNMNIYIVLVHIISTLSGLPYESKEKMTEPP